MDLQAGGGAREDFGPAEGVGLAGVVGGEQRVVHGVGNIRDVDRLQPGSRREGLAVVRKGDKRRGGPCQGQSRWVQSLGNCSSKAAERQGSRKTGREKKARHRDKQADRQTGRQADKIWMQAGTWRKGGGVTLLHSLVLAAVEKREDRLALGHERKVVEELVLAPGHGGRAEDCGARECGLHSLLACKLGAAAVAAAAWKAPSAGELSKPQSHLPILHFHVSWISSS